MKFQSKMGAAALEDFKEANAASLNVANEGWKGAGLGALAGLSSIFGLGGIAGGALSNEVEKKKAEVEKLAKQVEVAAVDSGRAAVAAGKMSKEDFDKHVKVGAKGIISGFILGSLFGPIYGAIKGSELENLLDELKSKGKELDLIVKAEVKRQGKPATEGLSVGNEGWKGVVLGAIAGSAMLLAPGTGAAVRSEVTKKRQELENLVKKVEELAIDNGRKAVKEGKMTDADFKEHIKIPGKEYLKGAIMGALFGPFYGAIKGHELEELLKQVEAKKKEINTILKDAGAKQGTPANESFWDKWTTALEEEETAPEGGTTSTDIAPGTDPANPVEGKEVTVAATGSDAPAAPAEGETPPEGEVPPETPPEGGEPEAPAEGGDPLDPPAEGSDTPPPEGETPPPADGDTPPEGETPPEETPPADPEAPAADAATSDAESTPEAPAEPEGDDEDPEAETIEAEMEKVDTIEDEEEEASDDVERLQDATEALEGLISSLDCAVQQGGYNTAGSMAVRNNLNTITKMLRVKQLSIPALEDMETPAARIEGASTLKDQVVKFVERVIKAIKEAFARFANWSIEVYKRLTNAYTALETRAIKLAERVEASEMQTEKITSKNIVVGMMVAGKPVDDLGGFLNDLGAFAKYMNAPSSYSHYLEAIAECEVMIKDPTAEEQARGKISESLKRWAEDMAKHAANITKLVQEQYPDKMSENTQFFTVPLLGQQMISVTLPNSAEGIAQLNAVLGSFSDDGSATDIAPLDKAGAKKICELVAQIAKATRESAESNKGGVKELTNEIKKRNDTITAMAKTLQNGMMEEAGTPEKVRKVISFINSFFLTAPKLPVHAINRALPRNLSAALNYVGASIAGKAAEPAETAPPKQLAA